MKKRKMMALLTAAAVMCSLAVPALADEAEGDLIPITFCRTADPLVEANVFANMEGATYETNIWTDLIAEKLRGFLSLGRIQLGNCNAEV